MTQRFKQAVLLGIASLGATLFVLSIVLTGEERPPEEKFEVVDHYGTCAVVRYTDRYNEWHYFLDCREVR